MKPLQTMLEHGTVLFVQHVPSQLDDQVRPNPDDVAIEGRMMQLAEGNPVRNDREPARIGVGDDVGRLEKLRMTQSADGASPLVGFENPLPERPLVQSLLHGGRPVGSNREFRILTRVLRRGTEFPGLGKLDVEGEFLWKVANDVHGPRGEIPTAVYPIEVRVSVQGGESLLSRAARAGARGAGREPLPVPEFPWAYDPRLKALGRLGETSPAGRVTIQPGLDAITRAETLRHEFIHRFLTPLGEGGVTAARQRLGSWFYERSAIMRVLEEGAAETYATRNLARGLAFPFQGGAVLTPGLGDVVVLGGAGGTAYVVLKPEGSP